MGYTTDFQGSFKLNKKLDQETHEFLVKLNETRRMKRKFTGADKKKYGVDGEFFVEGQGYAGQDNDASVVSHNDPPSTQPGLWCQWRPTDDGKAIELDGGEKFYQYIEWLKYIVDNILKPKGYVINGRVAWRGEDFEDMGFIIASDNEITSEAR